MYGFRQSFHATYRVCSYYVLSTFCVKMINSRLCKQFWQFFLSLIPLILILLVRFFPHQNKKQFSFLALECKEVLLEQQQQLTATIMIILQTVIIRERLIMALGFRWPKLPLLLFLQPWRPIKNMWGTKWIIWEPCRFQPRGLPIWLPCKDL